MNVLSLFDGMSCGRIALDRAGIKYDNYFASEIDKYAIQVAQKNYPDTIQVGDITDLETSDLRIDTSDGTNEKYDVEAKIDLLIGGSPCQGFSYAGTQLNFDDPRSALFFEFVRLLEELKPKYFLLENVKMNKRSEDVITEYMGVSPIEINSALVSAQNRKRLYWTNIPYKGNPRDKGIMLQDILEQDATEPMLSNIYGGFKEKEPRVHYGKSVTLRTPAGGGHIPSVALATDEMTSNGKAHCLTSTYYKLGTSDAAVDFSIRKRGRTMVGMSKAIPIKEQVKVRKHEVNVPSLQTCLLHHYKKKGKSIKEIALALEMDYSKVEHWFRGMGSKSFSIPDPEIWFDLKDYLGIETIEFDKPITEFEIRDGKFDMADRVYDPGYKAPTVMASAVSKVAIGGALRSRRDKAQIRKKGKGKQLEIRSDQKSNCITTVQTDSVVSMDKISYRKLTPLECERLQTVPEGYTEGVSNTQRYKMLGNGWTIDVIAHLFKGLGSGKSKKRYVTADLKSFL